MKTLRRAAVLVMTVSILLNNVSVALAVPPTPSSFYGTVKTGGANVPGGTVIHAKIDGVSYANALVETYLGDTVYSLNVPGDDPDTMGIIEGGVEGDMVEFYIGGVKADQTATWHSGTNINLNLTAGPWFSLYLPLVIR